MEPSTASGTLGVSLLLLAFLLNLFGAIRRESLGYIVMNILGAAFALTASVLIWFPPFIVLEIIWMIVGFAGLYHHLKMGEGRKPQAPFRLDPASIRRGEPHLP